MLLCGTCCLTVCIQLCFQNGDSIKSPRPKILHVLFLLIKLQHCIGSVCLLQSHLILFSVCRHWLSSHFCSKSEKQLWLLLYLNASCSLAAVGIKTRGVTQMYIETFVLVFIHMPFSLQVLTSQADLLH